MSGFLQHDSFYEEAEGEQSFLQHGLDNMTRFSRDAQYCRNP